MNENLFTTKEAARYLGVSASRIRQLAGKGTLLGEKIPPDAFRGNWYFSKEVLDQYVINRRTLK